jgi:branched-chain amino acid transport system permease protein
MIGIEAIVQSIINGVVIGSIYSLCAAGLSLVWGTMGILNLAHGEFYMLGGYVIFFSLSVYGINPFVSLLLSVIAAFLLGIVIQRVVIRPLLDTAQWDINIIIATVGLSFLLQNLALEFLGRNYLSVPYFVVGKLAIAGYNIVYHRILIIATSLLLLVACWLVIKRTMMGKAIQATAQERMGSQLVGINIHRVFLVTFGISTSLAACAGALLSPIFMVYPWVGGLVLGKALIVCVLGGLGSFKGAIVGGYMIGIAESLAVLFVATTWQDFVSFAIFILVLILRPTGLFRR